jgi:hypothetical protein
MTWLDSTIVPLYHHPVHVLDVIKLTEHKLSDDVGVVKVTNAHRQ